MPTLCEDCGRLTRHAVYQATPYRIRCPRCASKAKSPEHPCLQCGRDLGPERFLGAVCGRCCRANHKRVTGR